MLSREDRGGGAGGREEEGAGGVSWSLQPLFVLRVIGARGGMFKLFVLPFYRRRVCLREESRSKTGGVLSSVVNRPG